MRSAGLDALTPQNCTSAVAPATFTDETSTIQYPKRGCTSDMGTTLKGDATTLSSMLPKLKALVFELFDDER